MKGLAKMENRQSKEEPLDAASVLSVNVSLMLMPLLIAYDHVANTRRGEST
jgi:hypothetical protein